ncbi:unnamed protein product [Oikopleura dioica]|uniref:Major facilitator superfamily (MFS) profile domain-containing protein n=1 Tax=Oikopleura dioica TaxID=34765 RepID=E4YIZ8_OIKDI|nr:unnamed protein product [Oikopleura dioica]
MACGSELKFFIWILGYFFISGCEYALILPTINSYLVFLGAPSYYLGLVFGAFFLSGLIFAPIFGVLTDKWQNSKWPAVFGILCAIGGNVVYVSAPDAKWLILARFISGAGFSLDGSFMGSLSRLYPPSKKAKIFAMCLLIRQTGVTFAPGLIVFLQKISFRFIWTDVNRYSASGFIMACAWTLFFVLFLIFFKEPKEDENKEEIQLENTDHLKLKEEKTSEYENENGEKYTLRRLKEEESILKEPIIIGIFSCFCAFSANAGLESSITLLTKWLLGWDQVENAIIFVTAGLGAILSYGVVTLISTKRLLDDRQILLGSCCLCFCNLCFIGTILSVFEFGAIWLVPAMILGTFLLVISLPPMLTSAAVIIAKNTPKKDQAFVLSLRTTAERTTQVY